MHELSIAISILDAASEEARRHGAARVLAVHLRLGPLSGVIKEALCSAYELARDGSLLADTPLLIEDVPVVGHCPACRRDRPVVSIQEMCCAACGRPISRIISGRELEITALEIAE